jgi:hypothetical protein
MSQRNPERRYNPGDFVIQDGAPDRGVYRFVKMTKADSKFWAIPFGGENEIKLKVRKCRRATDEEIAKAVAKRMNANNGPFPDETQK